MISSFKNHTIRLVKAIDTSGSFQGWVCCYNEHFNNDYTKGGLNIDQTSVCKSKSAAILEAMHKINCFIVDEYDSEENYFKELGITPINIKFARR